jgi:tetratricopeptide (TPR) repeat protein
MRRDSQKRVILFLWIFSLLYLSSCGWLRKEQREQVPKEQVEREQGQKQPARNRASDVDKQAQMEVQAGNFQRAIDLWKETYQESPGNLHIRNGYVKTLESIKSRGDLAFSTSDFRLAERIYEVLGKNWIHYSQLSPFLSFRKDFFEKKIKISRCLYTEEQISSHMKAGEFRKAIDLCREMFKKYPQDSDVRSGYVRILESVKTSGDRAFTARDFALAGSVYEIVLRNMSPVNRLNGSLSFNSDGLTAKIRNCRKILFESGLEQYRSGNLNQAILLWKSILAFDPEDREIKRAVDMATLQYSNLQKAQ